LKRRYDDVHGTERENLGLARDVGLMGFWGIWGHYDRIEFNHDGVYMNLTALNIWEGFFRIMMANGSLILMTGIPGGLYCKAVPHEKEARKLVETQH